MVHHSCADHVPPVVVSPKHAPQPVLEASEVIVILGIRGNWGACNGMVWSMDTYQRRSCYASTDRGSLMSNWDVRTRLSSPSGSTEFIKAWIPCNVGGLLYCFGRGCGFPHKVG